MEDFSEHKMFSFEEDRLPYEYFLVAIEGLAEFHAEWMDHPMLSKKEFDWLDNTCLVDWTKEAYVLIKQIYKTNK